MLFCSVEPPAVQVYFPYKTAEHEFCFYDISAVELDALIDMKRRGWSNLNYMLYDEHELSSLFCLKHLVNWN